MRAFAWIVQNITEILNEAFCLLVYISAEAVVKNWPLSFVFHKRIDPFLAIVELFDGKSPE